MDIGPDELVTILSHCVVADALRLRSVSWQWHAAASDDLKRRPLQALPSCRMHEPVYPAVGEDVVVEVRSLCTNQFPLGAYVALLEYNKIEGFVSPLFRRSRILRQRPRWARHDLKRRPLQALPSCRMHEPVYPAVGEDVVVEAVEDLAATTEMGTAGHEARVQSAAVDEPKGYIDLSPPWSLSKEEIVGCEDRFLRYSLVHAVVRAVSRSTGVEMKDVYQQVVWPLSASCGSVFDTLFRCDRAQARLDTSSPSSDALLAALLETARAAKEGRTLTSAQIRSCIGAAVDVAAH
eukprot:CAMPEP_0185533068 /NCGR_PEP_ID=MMETSP1366-20130426/108261_1 /TAXON_ID=38817 /ORGANISM="Gephyrocapsa oceanica, Strain RCC1303" /LENGTH=292 /DNA_ID=CAMNT_0028144791 /DNA_START=36 /DNA_END=915 /DNA_ORIENTATION=-